MHRRFCFLALLTLATLAIALVPGRFMAEAQSNVCVNVENRVAADVGRNCSDLAPSEACYGYSEVSSLLLDGVTSSPLSEPGDTVPLAETLLLESSGLDLQNDLWGAAPMHVQGDIPMALPGRGLTMTTFGQVTVGNGVLAEDSGGAYLYPEEALAVKTSGAATLYDEADSASEVAGTADADTELLADAISSDGAWVRVYHEWEGRFARRAYAWVNVSVLETFDASLLPVMVTDPASRMLTNEESLTPMQSFYFLGSDEDSACMPTPAGMVMVQSPKNYETRFMVNGAPVMIASTVVFTIVEPNRMEMVVLSGMAVLCEGTPNEFVVPQGFAVNLPLSVEDIEIGGTVFSGAVGCDWNNLRLLTQTEIEAYSMLENVPDNIINEEVQLPTVICPSGVGNPVCSIVVTDATLLATYQRLCADNIITAPVCARIRGL